MSLRLSTKTRYGLRAIIDLAKYYGKGPVMARAIAEEEGISENYLEQIMDPLKKSGLVRSVRGARGGFVLAKPPGNIRVKEVIEALEGPVLLVDCLYDPNLCERSKSCIARLFWERLRDNIVDFLNSWTLEDFISKGYSGKNQAVDF
ncbi:MAG TPA: Rrf2 family transcriptional regulator [bacterium]|jgi:Rrf2 family protein|nr:Rrf2 family transcriptional regulator [Dictyoglomota bacterium]HHV80802.1 Rrf2 family transcriptional regulator [bacterium]HOL55783.1 Rrf2 family transcriptional regulator [bacterium]HPC77686.1 Rrf2 family transcriptional regulator [bacterium]HPO83010.1 Rrf2 family transcriptional regulator [bacterium]